jgi:hypothetical protein
MRLLFCLLLAIGCGDNHPNQNICGELGDKPCCPGPGRPDRLSCTPGGTCWDALNSFSCSCDVSATWYCQSIGGRDLSVTSSD